jgi:hypothetical protein
MNNKNKNKNIILNIKLIICVVCVSFLGSCFGGPPNTISSKHYLLEIDKSTKKVVKEQIDYDDSKLFALNHPDFKNDKYEVVIAKNPLFKEEQLYYFYLLKNDILHYYGYPYQFNMNENEMIRIAGELATDILIKEEDIEIIK